MKTLKLFCLLVGIMLVLPLISATDIAYVLKNPSNPNSVFIDVINELNYTYDLIDDVNFSVTDFSEYEMILVGDENFGNYKEIPVNDYNSLVVNSYHYYRKGTIFPDSQWGFSKEQGRQSSPSTIRIIDYDISITDNLPEFIRSYTISGPDVQTYYLKGQKPNGIRLLSYVFGSAHTNGDSNLAVVYPGTRMLNGKTNEGNSIFFGATSSKYWTAESRVLFKNSITWLIEGEHLNQAPVLDSEIPDLIWVVDEAQFSFDLNDYFSDPDGDILNYAVDDTSSNQNIIVNIVDSIVTFISSPGWIGTDWISFSASDGKLKTISNRVDLMVTDHVPIFNPIGKKTVREGETLEFLVHAVDPDGGDINLSAENLPVGANFVDRGNGEGRFSWTPGLNDSGNYEVKFIASDGEFTSFKKVIIVVSNVIEPPRFSDVNLCSEKNPGIEIKIKEPDDGDDFNVGDEIKIELEIENNLDEDLDFDVEVHLYDLDEDESIEEDSDNLKVKDGRTEDLEFVLTVPSDIEENEFVILVIAEDGFCNYEYVEINLEKEDHLVTIEDINSPAQVSQGENFNVEIRVENNGKEDEENVYIVAEISGLNVQGQTEEFDLDEDDRETGKISLTIPEGVEDGNYELKVTVFFDDGDEENSETKSIEVLEKIISVGSSKTGGNVQENNLIALSNKFSSGLPVALKEKVDVKEKSSSQSSGKTVYIYGMDQNIFLLIVDIFLIIGIIIEIVLIVKVA